VLPILAWLNISFQARVECVRMNPGEQSQCQWMPIPHRGPTTDNAWVCLVEVRVEGTRSTPHFIERRYLQPLKLEVGQQNVKVGVLTFMDLMDP